MSIWKQLFCACALVLCAALGTVAGAHDGAAQPRVMTLVWISPGLVSDETKTRDLINDALRQKLAAYPVEVLDADRSQEMFDEFLMENDLTPDDDSHSRGFLPKKDYLRALAEESGADYVLYINTRITDEKVKAAWLSWAGFKYEVSTLFNVLLYSVKGHKYIINQKVSVKENAAGTSSTERAFNKSCETFAKKHLDLSEVPF